MLGENKTLFDVSEYRDEKMRKAPESETQKKLNDIQMMEERDFKNLGNKLNSGKPFDFSGFWLLIVNYGFVMNANAGGLSMSSGPGASLQNLLA